MISGEVVAAVHDRRKDVAPTENGGNRPTLQEESEGAPNAWPDESAESAMAAELRERGEPSVVKTATDAAEESAPKNLPPLEEMVQRLSPTVREALDDLFRVKFVRVVRVPQRALEE